MTKSRATRRLAPRPPEAAEMLHLARENLRLLTALTARFEVARLDALAGPPILGSPDAVAAYLQPELADLAQEQLRVVPLDTRYRLLGIQLVYQGGVNATAIRLADCFREAVARGAIGLILVHNHPSGDPTPSAEDVRLTADAGRAGRLLGIEVLDHVVIARQGHVSLREHGLYRPGDVAPSDDGQCDLPGTTSGGGAADV